MIAFAPSGAPPRAAPTGRSIACLLAATFVTAAQHSHTIQSRRGVQRKRPRNFSAHFCEVRDGDPQPVHALQNAHPLVVSPCCGIIFSLTSKGGEQMVPRGVELIVRCRMTLRQTVSSRCVCACKGRSTRFPRRLPGIRIFREAKVLVGRPLGLARFDSCQLLEVERCTHC